MSALTGCRIMMPISCTLKSVAAIALLLGANISVFAQQAGEVEFSRGVGFAQAPGQMPRTLGKGLRLEEGDRLTTSEGSAAIVKLQDGTRMTLRPNSELVMQQYKFKDGASDNGMVMQLLRGGFRAITGLISKNSPNAARVQTATATIGIRGTDFDARVCSQDCKQESSRAPEGSRPNAVLASAKLVAAKGNVAAVTLAGIRRGLVDGGSVYPGETVEVSAGASGVLAFRDNSKMTLGSGARFRVDSFVFDDKNPTEGKFLVSLLRGSLRAITGLIGKANNRNVSFTTPTATVGIRGTGLDIECNLGVSGSESDNCNIFNWQGVIEVTQVGQALARTLQVGEGLTVTRTDVRPLLSPTLEHLQRPDGVSVDPKLFSTGGVSPDEEGLYVYVRDGHIELTSSKEVLELGRGETGFAGADGRTGRPVDMPKFILFDRTPMPNSPNPQLGSLLGDGVKSSANQCR